MMGFFVVCLRGTPDGGVSNICRDDPLHQFHGNDKLHGVRSGQGEYHFISLFKPVFSSFKKKVALAVLG